MSAEKSVMVFIEVNNKKIADVSLELVCEAKRLADILDVPVTAVAMGHEIKEELEILGHYGCSTVYYTEDSRLAHFTSVPYAKTIVKIIQKYKPRIVLFGASTTGRDIAPRVASELKCGLTADCTELQIGDHKVKDKKYTNILLQIRPAFGGNIVATIVSPESFPSMASVREGVMKLTEPIPSGSVAIIAEKCELPENDFLTEVIDVSLEEKSVNLKSSHVIIAAGMGACNPAALKLIKELARVLGGEVAASRPAVDSGMLIKDRQVGQTGVTVRPTLYIACGISGQIQHRAGMSDAKRIIAINSDPNAPIFNIAHYGIVGDVNDVVSKMIKAYKAKA